MIESAVTDLPLPDSPTTPSVPACVDLEVDAVDGADQAARAVSNHGAQVLDASNGTLTPLHCRCSALGRRARRTSMWSSSCSSGARGSRDWSAREQLRRCSTTDLARGLPTRP